MKQDNKIQWLSLLRGLNILLVVMFHVQLIDMQTGENHEFCNDICFPFNPIRMPLFIFCSGGLLYLSRIKKEWDVKSLYIDKFYRIVCPFLFFVSFFYFFKLAMNPFVKTKMAFSLSDFIESFYDHANHPSSHLWFLDVLFWFMLLYPLFKWICKKDYRTILFFLFSIIFYFLDTSYFLKYNYFSFFILNRYLVFFFFGIFFFKFELYKYLDNIVIFLISLLIYIGLYYLKIPLLLSLSGIIMMVSLSQLIARFIPYLFSSFREYIYQIYLMSFIFQPFVELILWKKLFYNENLFYLFYVISVLFGIYLPVIITLMVKKCPYRWPKIFLGIK